MTLLQDLISQHCIKINIIRSQIQIINLTLKFKLINLDGEVICDVINIRENINKINKTIINIASSADLINIFSFNSC